MKIVKMAGINCLYAFVDDEDFEMVSKYKWFLSIRSKTHFSARTHSKDHGRKISMHRFIMDVLDESCMIDHKDHNPLNNMKLNLRKCTGSQNQRNRTAKKTGRSKYLGVVYVKQMQKRFVQYKNEIVTYTSPGWAARAVVDGKAKHLGVFKDEIKAAKAYDKFVVENFGEFANPNFPEDFNS